MPDYGSISFWHETLGDDQSPRPPLSQAGGAGFDVVIMGAGFTGLWTAVYLMRLDPDLRVAVVEKEIAGFGASGRNGGWCSALFPITAEALEKKYGFEAAVSMRQAMVATVDEIGRIAAELGIDCDYRRGGTYSVARSAAQLERANAEIAAANEYGVDQLQWLEPERGPRFSNSLGSVYDPACASIHPAKLVRGLARAAEALGVTIFEHTEVLSFSKGHVQTNRGELVAKIIVDALEGYRSNLKQLRRKSIPIYSLMIATEVLPEEAFEDIGLPPGATFADFRHLLIYGQRTADNRIAFGGRGAPYHFGSRIKPEYDQVPRIFEHLEASLRELIPQLGDVKITHRWGGALGVSRDWHAAVRFDPSTGLAMAGGYVGDGVGTSNLAGRTLAHLITAVPSPLTELAWVGHQSPSWEPEPLRFIGAAGGVLAAELADRVEARTGRRSLIARALGLITGKI